MVQNCCVPLCAKRTSVQMYKCTSEQMYKCICVAQIKGFKIAALNITSLLIHIDELRVQMFNKTLDTVY